LVHCLGSFGVLDGQEIVDCIAAQERLHHFAEFAPTWSVWGEQYVRFIWTEKFIANIVDGSAGVY
jgi:hypothetical protein